jgi:hypothetical protein
MTEQESRAAPDRRHAERRVRRAVGFPVFRKVLNSVVLGTTGGALCVAGGAGWLAGFALLIGAVVEAFQIPSRHRKTRAFMEILRTSTCDEADITIADAMMVARPVDREKAPITVPVIHSPGRPSERMSAALFRSPELVGWAVAVTAHHVIFSSVASPAPLYLRNVESYGSGRGSDAMETQDVEAVVRGE